MKRYSQMQIMIAHDFSKQQGYNGVFNEVLAIKFLDWYYLSDYNRKNQFIFWDSIDPITGCKK